MRACAVSRVVCIVAVFSVIAWRAEANTIESSTLYFSGALTEGSGGWYGTLPATTGRYYVPGGPGTHPDASQPSGWAAPDGTNARGGFDLYAKEGAMAYLDPYGEIQVVDHDYQRQGGPWGSWYSPDCSDWENYSLQVAGTHWSLNLTTPWTTGVPLQGTVDWARNFFTVDDQRWYAHWDWGYDICPLELPGFLMTTEDVGGHVQYVLTPAPEPSSLAILGTIALSLLAYAWRRRLSRRLFACLAVVLTSFSTTMLQADVFNMGGTRNPSHVQPWQV